MSMGDYERAKSMIAASKGRAHFAGPRAETLVRKAAEALGVHFPPAYRRFLMEYGAGSFGSAEFYGVIDEDFEDSSVPDGIWCTLEERKNSNLPHELVVVGDTGTGEFYCLDLSVAEGPVVIVDPGSDFRQREPVAADFGAFFLQRIERVAQ